MEIQKVFSDNLGEERIYSVLLTEDEMALYQAMYSDEEDKMGKGKKAAIIAGTGATAGAGAIVGAKYAGKALRGHAAKIRNAAIEEGTFGGKASKKNARMVNVGRTLEKPADTIVKGAGKVKDATKNVAGKVSEAGKNTVEKSKGLAGKAANWAKAHPGKAAGIGAGVAAVGAGTVYGVKKYRDNKKNK